MTTHKSREKELINHIIKKNGSKREKVGDNLHKFANPNSLAMILKTNNSAFGISKVFKKQPKMIPKHH